LREPWKLSAMNRTRIYPSSSGPAAAAARATSWLMYHSEDVFLCITAGDCLVCAAGRGEVFKSNWGWDFWADQRGTLRRQRRHSIIFLIHWIYKQEAEIYWIGCDTEMRQEIVWECPDIVAIDYITFAELGGRDLHINESDCFDYNEWSRRHHSGHLHMMIKVLLWWPNLIPGMFLLFLLRCGFLWRPALSHCDAQVPSENLKRFLVARAAFAGLASTHSTFMRPACSTSIRSTSNDPATATPVRLASGRAADSVERSLTNVQNMGKWR
jgi:hypothetical protein